MLSGFFNILLFRELSDRTGIRSLTSLRTLADSCMLYKLITCPLNTEITLRLIQQCTFSFRYPNKLVFFDFSTKKLGSSSFINRAKKISEPISFEWHDISFATFKYKLKKSTPIFMLWRTSKSYKVLWIHCTQMNYLFPHLQERIVLLGGFSPW